jgi:hypothetical protein
LFYSITNRKQKQAGAGHSAPACFAFQRLRHALLLRQKNFAACHSRVYMMLPFIKRKNIQAIEAYRYPFFACWKKRLALISRF